MTQEFYDNLYIVVNAYSSGNLRLVVTTPERYSEMNNAIIFLASKLPKSVSPNCVETKTLRDEFAMAALVCCVDAQSYQVPSCIVEAAYDVADAMMKWRSK